MTILHFLFVVRIKIRNFFSRIRHRHDQQNENVIQNEENISVEQYRRVLVTLSRYLSALYSLLNAVNLTLLFMWTGHCPTLIERILGMKVKYLHPSMARRVSFEFMNRQLVWNGFTEFMLFVMPLINVQKLRSTMWSLLTRVPLLGSWINSPSPSSFQIDGRSQSSCPLCGSDPIHTPYITNCQHLYCYYCIKLALMCEDKLLCARCRQHITHISRYQPQT
jgi:peroxin-2